MKKAILLILALTALSAYTYAQDILELDPTQSMCITGKGPGQDAALNPYMEQNSIGIIKNIGEKPFQVRLQKQGKIIEILTVEPKETQEVALLAGYELYLDSDEKGSARVSFRKGEK